jgi:hypothetical protein
MEGKHMRKAIGVGGFGAIAIVAMFMMSAAPIVGACDPASSIEVILYAGQKDIGATVYVEHDTKNFYVTYTMPKGWWLSETHVAISLNGIDEIPQTKKGNPIPGQFEYSQTHNPMVDEYTYTIPFPADFEWGDCVCFATHAVVKKVVDGVVTQEQTGWGGENDFPGKNWALYFCYKPLWYKKAVLPSSATVSISHSGGTHDCDGVNYYWKAVVTAGGTGNMPNSGTGEFYYGWCIDKGVTIGSGSMTFDVYAYYDSAMPSDEWTNPWGKINWILNNKDGYDGTEIQHVLWYLVGEWAYGSLTTDEKALADAANTHADFIPWAGDMMAVVIQYGTSQSIFIEVDP